jgi:hypothetical protein
MGCAADGWCLDLQQTLFAIVLTPLISPDSEDTEEAPPCKSTDARLMPRAMAAAKKKNDRVDAQKICDCLRCDFLRR